MTLTASSAIAAPVRERPVRIGCVGLGWIGLNRCEALLGSGLAQLDCYLDCDERAREAAARLNPRAACVGSLRELLGMAPEGVVIATPSALHAEQAIAALEAGCAVFCQKPLGRNARETKCVVEAARTADRLLEVDLSYRQLRAVRAVRSVIASGALGRIYACNLVFHNAYGPDKKWYYELEQSGGGCLIDLGIHLVDLALEMLEEGELRTLSAATYAHGKRLRRRGDDVEDYVTAHLMNEDGCSVELACSWNLPAGCDARICAEFFGASGGVALHNVNGSFYDFQAELYQGTRRSVLEQPPDDWSGRAIVGWARRLQGDSHFDPQVESMVRAAQVLDEIYDVAGGGTNAAAGGA